jgi:glycosyltransferase involved in cell wall biosynthesis
MYRVAYVVSHPIQYQAPLLRRIASESDIGLKVFFLDDVSLYEHHERAFSHAFRWDVPLTDGYDWEVMSGRGRPESLPATGLKDRLRAGNFDAVWVHGWGRIGLIRAVASAHSLNLPVLLRGESTPGSSSTIATIFLRNMFLRWLFRRVAGFLYIGGLNREFYRLRGVSDERLFFVPYAVDNNWFRERCQEASRRRDTLRQELGLDSGRAVIMFAGKLIPEKAPQDLLAGFLNVISKGDGKAPYLLIVGDGPLRNSLERQAGEHIGKNVRFLGFRNQTELPPLYDLCDLFVLPSRFEPWGLVLNEVMNAGRPVVISDKVGAGPDLVHNRKNGWVFPAGDIQALTDSILEALTCADLNNMGQESKKIVSGWDFEADVVGLKRALTYVTHT